MNVRIVKDYPEISETAAQHVYDCIQQKEKITIGLATGDTPLGLYRELLRLHHEHPLNVSKLTTFNLDEYVGEAAESSCSYRYYMNQQLFLPLGIPLAQTHVPDGMAADIEAECEQYEAQMKAVGGIDLQVLGVGRNGHIGFNEPGTSFDSHTHKVELSSSTREANAKHFGSLERVPQHAITMGIASILHAKEILLLASGERKAQAMFQLLEGEVTNEWPVTVLRRHANVTVLMDEEAASLLSDKALDNIKVTHR
ncbi:glucosamine-6-phosphate deaminase [Aneurinibacillus aneurinilyticus]|uniref:glucosamine-6-phosphate deaminase n=1 Tax=Aneurinibacillus aneurinilyticus TaxID=1391 RepID=UPI000411ADE0|nr:glucosamine-6-phosphate deaminase [Aneurinibacillus aneurinilyticus]MCI1692732.1 glucosamine-6-phosphate deaminase [Aneurinibacillus aneurinilyticus]MED0668762.1 glucosamine-6-phosphate deaminase [Aneurinibacillus aneurinilyticus]MED0707216.1 glucosamine-6-phosphate deaminase [Aneurinibacillus aneurinilyticus]MED0722047.1 glucosamine-6-phosphate deaminase [Aneurinibacillus aneurinilyticus]MED0732556.1 glucosamine-6-phosphate deaminase [Aneurinibacillus aneurinilyticus]